MKTILSSILALSFISGLSAFAFAGDGWMKTRAEDLPFEHTFDDSETTSDKVVASTVQVNPDKSSEVPTNEDIFAEFDKPWRLH